MDTKFYSTSYLFFISKFYNQWPNGRKIIPDKNPLPTFKLFGGQYMTLLVLEVCLSLISNLSSEIFVSNCFTDELLSWCSCSNLDWFWRFHFVLKCKKYLSVSFFSNTFKKFYSFQNIVCRIFGDVYPSKRWKSILKNCLR